MVSPPDRRERRIEADSPGFRPRAREWDAGSPLPTAPRASLLCCIACMIVRCEGRCGIRGTPKRAQSSRLDTRPWTEPHPLLKCPEELPQDPMHAAVRLSIAEGVLARSVPRIDNFDANSGEVTHIASDNCEAMVTRRSGNQSVDSWNSPLGARGQSAPFLRNMDIYREHAILIEPSGKLRFEPCTDSVAAIPVRDPLDPLPNLSECQHAYEQCLLRRCLEPFADPPGRLGLHQFRQCAGVD